MNAALDRYGPTLGLLYGATYWGIVWYPTRWLESLGMQGAWLTLVAYTTAALVFFPFSRLTLTGLGRQPWESAGLFVAAGWTNVAFVLAVLDGLRRMVGARVAREIVALFRSDAPRRIRAPRWVRWSPGPTTSGCAVMSTWASPKAPIW